MRKFLFIEDDDWYAPTYLETMVALLDGAQVVTADLAQDYNVRFRSYEENYFVQLHQMGMRGESLPLLKLICEHLGGVDTELWRSAGTRKLHPNRLCVGIKGLPGRPGQVGSHEPVPWMKDDPALSVLSAWIGEDAEVYREFGEVWANLRIGIRKVLGLGAAAR